MKSPFGKAFAATLVLGLALLPLSMPAQPRARPQAPTPAPAKGKGGERHPEVQAALRALQNAKSHLQEGAHDFEGHRAEALKLTDQAIRECQEALKADKN